MASRPSARLVHRAASWALAVALLAYPRGFRRRFGREVRADFDRLLDEAGPLQVIRTLLAHVGQGLAERSAAFARWLWWPSVRPHLY